MALENSNSEANRSAAIPFEDIIDGYFPLRESLRQMLVRNGFAAACVTLVHAPIMNISGLAPHKPVPLRLDHGTAGIADRLDIIVALYGQEPRLSGYGRWRWYSDGDGSDDLMAPSTRLAEPAIVQGFGLSAGGFHTETFDSGAFWQKSDFVVCRKT
jgi:hypothetical protein